MDTSKFEVILDASDKDFVEKLRVALDLKDGEQVQFITPQFERTDGRKITYFPQTVREFDSLKNLDSETLKGLGLGIWATENGYTHWLYPYEWFDFIPDGYEMVCISGEKELFSKSTTDNDKRFGCLAYGFLQPVH